MSLFSRVQDESNNAGIEFLLTELDAAFTFLDVAAATNSSETRERNQGHACEAYCTARRMQKNVVMESARHNIFQERLALLKSRLEDLGICPAETDH